MLGYYFNFLKCRKAVPHAVAALPFTPVSLCGLLLLWYNFTKELIDIELFKL